MAQRTVLGNHTSSNRDSWWYLEQDDDGGLFVRYENDDHSDDWRKPLAQVLANLTSSAAQRVQARVDRMFEDRDALRT